MRIKKTDQSVGVTAKVVHEKSTNADNVYGVDYINDLTEKGYKSTEMYRNSTLNITSGEEATLGILTNVTTHGRPLMVFVSINSKTTNANGSGRLYVDGTSNKAIVSIGVSQHEYNDMTIVTNVPAGTHTFEFKVSADSNSGTITIYPYYINSFTVIEL